MLYLLLVFMPMAGAFGVVWAASASQIKKENREKVRDDLAVIITAAVFAVSLVLLWRTLRGGGTDVFEVRGILYSGLSFTSDGFRAVYALVTSVMWLFTTIFSLEYFAHEREHLTRYFFFVLVTLGATEGVMLSADLMTSFVFFEILSFTSFTWVIHEETSEAIRAGYTYLFIAVIGGLVLFMGLLLLSDAAGTLRFSELYGMRSALSRDGEALAGGICILIGFGAKAGMFPVHIWLPKAHPVAPSPGSALLSGILTKVGIYGILMTSLNVLPESAAFGELVLLLGTVTMALGAVLALFSVNLKRTLACSSMSQVGFILTGVGMYILLSSAGVEEGMMLAEAGLMLHMLNHSMIKLTLFMAAGVVVMNLHTLDLNDLRGWGRNKPFLKVSFALGALGISGVPLFNGYISKTLLHEGIVEGIHEAGEITGGFFRMTPGFLRAEEWIFLISGGLTFAYMLKLFLCIFVEENTQGKAAAYKENRNCMNPVSTAVIFGSSLVMALLGQPAVMVRIAAFMTGMEDMLHFKAFTWTNLKGGLISLGIGAAVYLLIVRNVLFRAEGVSSGTGKLTRAGQYVNLWPEWLDLEDRVYRPVLVRYLPAVFGTIISFFGENRLLAPAAKAVVLAGAFTARVLTDSMDAVIVFLRKTVVRERRVHGPGDLSGGAFINLREATSETAGPLFRNFSFALFMTCIGILVILGVVLVLML